jgi:hypothetical protein
MLSILVLPFAFHSVHAQAAQTKTGTAMVSGRVTLKGEPARGVMVVLQTQNQTASNSPRARTDESGRFNFTGIPAGRYSVYAAAPGYVSPEDTNFNMRGKTLNLADGEKVENVDLEIKRGGVIAGKITDSQGRPVIEERINLIKFDATISLEPTTFIPRTMIYTRPTIVVSIASTGCPKGAICSALDTRRVPVPSQLLPDANFIHASFTLMRPANPRRK